MSKSIYSTVAEDVEEEAPPPPPPRAESLTRAPARPLPAIPTSASLGKCNSPCSLPQHPAMYSPCPHNAFNTSLIMHTKKRGTIEIIHYFTNIPERPQFPTFRQALLLGKMSFRAQYFRPNSFCSTLTTSRITTSHALRVLYSSVSFVYIKI